MRKSQMREVGAFTVARLHVIQFFLRWLTVKFYKLKLGTSLNLIHTHCCCNSVAGYTDCSAVAY